MHNNSIDPSFSQRSTNPYIPNSASIPNILFDYWMPRLTPSEFKVLMAIARKTYGWRKEIDAISVKQLELITGLSRRSVFDAVKELTNTGLISKIKSKTEDGDEAANKYVIHIDGSGAEQEEGVQKKGGGGAKFAPPVVQKTSHTKPTITKPNDDDDAHTREDRGNVHNSASDSSSPQAVEKIKANGEKIQCTQSEYFRYCSKFQTGFTTDEILEAWARFVQCDGRIGDWKKYLDQIIINNRRNSCNSQTKSEKKETNDSKKKYEDAKYIHSVDVSQTHLSPPRKRVPVTQELLDKLRLT